MDEVRPPAGGRVPRLPTVAGYFALVWSHIGLITAATMLGGAVGVALQLRVPQVYQASAAVELPYVPTWVDVGASGDLAPKGTTIDSTARLVFSGPVTEQVEAATGLSAQTVADGLGVAAYPLSRVLIVSFEARTAADAVAGADAAAKELIEERGRALLGSRQRLASRLTKRLNGLADAADIRVGPFNPVSRRLREQAADILKVRQDSSNDRARVVNDAFPAHPVSQHGELQVTTCVMLGLLGGVAWAWFLPTRRRSQAALSFSGRSRIFTALPSALDPPRLATFPYAPADDRSRQPRTTKPRTTTDPTAPDPTPPDQKGKSL